MFEKRDPVKVLLFSFLTLGIYTIYWWFKTYEALKEQGKDIPHWILLFIPIVSFYWLYKLFVAVEEVTNKEFNAILWLILCVIPYVNFIGIFGSIYLIQKGLNTHLGGEM